MVQTENRDDSKVMRQKTHFNQSWLLIGTPIFYLTASFFIFDYQNLGLGDLLIEAAFFCAALFALISNTLRFPGIFIFLGIYLTSRVFWAIFVNSSPLDETLRSHKWLFYILALLALVGSSWTKSEHATYFVKVLFFLVFSKYLWIKVSFGFDVRPYAITENNYELALLAGLLVLYFGKFGRWRVLFLMFFSATVLLSGSRSAAVALIVASIFIFSQLPSSRIALKYWSSLFSLATLMLAILVFESRSEEGVAIDRSNFASQFFYNTSDWNLWNWIFGTEPISQLAPETCSSLSFYASLLSSSGDGSCYSVILHMFAVRIIFDSGLLGLLLLLSLLWWILRKGGVESSLALALISLGIVNSLSVSGFNNVFVMLPFALALLDNPLKSEFDSQSASIQSAKP
jgi:hypothetical protein